MTLVEFLRQRSTASRQVTSWKITDLFRFLQLHTQALDFGRADCLERAAHIERNENEGTDRRRVLIVYPDVRCVCSNEFRRPFL